MTQQNYTADFGKQLAGRAAAELVTEGMLIGLGTGSTASYFLHALAQRLRDGLHIRGAIPSSQETQTLAETLKIPLTTLDLHPVLDLYIDGADEIDPQLQLIKGAGGALLREKVVASASRRFVVIADASKKVRQLGEHYPVPVECIPFAATPVQRQLEALGAQVQLRQHAQSSYRTDNGNFIFDCTFRPHIDDPVALDTYIHHIVGVIETGLFLHMAQLAIVAGPDGIQYLTSNPS